MYLHFHNTFVAVWKQLVQQNNEFNYFSETVLYA